jgi:hypothetical protein
LIWWNFEGEPNGFYLTMILVSGETADGTAWANIYQVPPGHRNRSIGQAFVTINGTANIVSIAFYGDIR